MADTAIKVCGRAGAGLLVVGRRFRMMLMLVMAQMPRRRALLMLAIASDRRPGDLKRQQCQKQDGEKLAHEGDFIRPLRQPAVCRSQAGKSMMAAPPAAR